jgi:DNA invertase Pin-like site-specific DNA recombinase
MTRRVALYLRVSTDRQTTDNQEAALREVAARAGWEVVEVYVDQGISGAKGREARPAFDAMCKDAVRRRFDVVAAWSLDRLGRSLKDLLNFLSELKAAGVDLFLHQQGLDTATTTGKMMFHMVGMFAEFERDIIRDRVNAGLARAKAQGKQLGRRKIAVKVERAIRADLQAGGAGIQKLAKRHGVGVGTVQRIRAELAATVQ